MCTVYRAHRPGHPMIQFLSFHFFDRDFFHRWYFTTDHFLHNIFHFLLFFIFCHCFSVSETILILLQLCYRNKRQNKEENEKKALLPIGFRSQSHLLLVFVSDSSCRFSLFHSLILTLYAFPQIQSKFRKSKIQIVKKQTKWKTKKKSVHKGKGKSKKISPNHRSTDKNVKWEQKSNNSIPPAFLELPPSPFLFFFFGILFGFRIIIIWCV